MLKRVIFIAVLLVIASSFVAAQLVAAQADGDGQFCVRAFEDRNGNGTKDSSEPFLTGGIVAELSNADGVVIASAALEDSSTAASGVICFPNLAPGDYIVSVSSADYAATTANTQTASIAAGELPVILEYGGALRAAAISPTPTSNSLFDALRLNSPDGRTLVERIAFSLVGALAMIALMTVLGIFIWSAILRPRAVRAQAKRASSTGQYRAVTRDDMLSMYAPPNEDEG